MHRYGVNNSLVSESDIQEGRLPFCVVWTPLPGLTWLLPFIGHVGICSSDGEVHDFAGPYYISVGNMAFGKPLKFMRLDVSQQETRLWDDAIMEADSIHQSRMHNIFCNNCHHHVTDALNAVEKGRRWNQLRLCMTLLLNARFVSWTGMARAYLPFIFVLTAVIFLTA
jgi:hypothetical protein